MRTIAKVDRNQNEIVSALRSAGAFVLDIHQLKNAFDVLVGFRGKLFIMEIKDGELPPSARKLSSGEDKCRLGFESVGIPYYVVLSVDDALKIITTKKNNTEKSVVYCGDCCFPLTLVRPGKYQCDYKHCPSNNR